MSSSGKTSFSIKELRKKCQDKGPGRFYIDWTDYPSRVLSIYFTKVFLKLGVSANQVTVASLLLGLVIAVLAGLSGPLMMLIAGILLYLFLVLDCSDGEIARFHHKQSYTGFYLDRMVPAVVYPALVFGIGIGIFRQTANIWDIILAFIAASSMLWLRISRSYIYSSSLESLLYSKVKPMKSALGYEDLPQSAEGTTAKVDEPGLLKKFPLLGFVANLIIVNGWAMVLWLWVASAVSLSALIFGHPAFIVEILRPLIWLYAICAPLATVYLVWRTIKSRLPDAIALSLRGEARDKSEDS